jgi:uncharacterized membrane protein YfcA
MPVEWPIALLLCLAAGAAGWVDAVAGGGGLIQLPSVLAAGITQPAASCVNKTSSICGTTAALIRYARHGHVHWADVPRCGALAMAGSAFGSMVLIRVARSAQDALVPLFAVCFLALAVQQVLKVLRPSPHDATRRRRPWLGYALMFGIGTYDGFIGPGAGMFLFWTFTTCFALAPLAATGTTKAINVLTNFGALVPLLVRGHTHWPLALGMAGANVLGGTLGSHAAIHRGAGLVRLVAAFVSVAASIYLLVR